MIYYKNILLNLSNGLRSKQVSSVYNPNSDFDALMLSCALLSKTPVVASNGKRYYYFNDSLGDFNVLQHVLNRNGVLAYRRYSRYQVFYGGRRKIVRVPVKYVTSHKNAQSFMDRVIDSVPQAKKVKEADIQQFVADVKKHMR